MGKVVLQLGHELLRILRWIKTPSQPYPVLDGQGRFAKQGPSLAHVVRIRFDQHRLHRYLCAACDHTDTAFERIDRIPGGAGAFRKQQQVTAAFKIADGQG